MSERKTGVVKFYDEVKGWGFITPDDGSDELFVHRTELAKARLQLMEDDRVSFVASPGNKGKGPKATEVQLVR